LNNLFVNQLLLLLLVGFPSLNAPHHLVRVLLLGELRVHHHDRCSGKQGWIRSPLDDFEREHLLQLQLRLLVLSCRYDTVTSERKLQLLRKPQYTNELRESLLLYYLRSDHGNLNHIKDHQSYACKSKHETYL
jgi:hypothetical protein